MTCGADRTSSGVSSAELFTSLYAPKAGDAAQLQVTIGLLEQYAQAHADDLKGGYVEHRPGEPIRCLHYCPVAGFCPQRQAELAASLDLAA